MHRNEVGLTINGGRTKHGDPEQVRRLGLRAGDVVALVGPTGSGKSQLLSDIEQRAAGDTPTGRTVQVPGYNGSGGGDGCIAELSQSMRFVMDLGVAEFLGVHADSRDVAREEVRHVIDLANELSGEPFTGSAPLSSLSGGQSRALMIADIALISRAPIVLIDEIENAGIDKTRALEILAEEGKTVLIASHDPVVILKARRRVVMRDGGMHAVRDRSNEEEQLLDELVAFDRQVGCVRAVLREGGPAGDIFLHALERKVL